VRCNVRTKAKGRLVFVLVEARKRSLTGICEGEKNVGAVFITSDGGRIEN
jgi:hypothetical protein